MVALPQRSTSDVFGTPIYAYTRAQALEDGVLIDVTKLASEAGFVWPVALTTAAWADSVAWSDEDNARKGTVNDETGRLWDLLHMASVAVRRSRQGNGRELLFKFLRVPRNGRGHKPRLNTLKLVTGPGDDMEPVVTIMLVDED